MEEINSVQRKIKQQRLLRKARRGEIAIRRLYKFVRFLIVISIIYSIYRLSFSHYWYFPKDIYNKHTQILGNKIVNSNKIINKMKNVPLPKKPIYMINPADIAREIEKLPPVKRAYVRRFWFPARFIVMVEEITPAITISPSENAPDVAAFSFTGELISREYLPLNPEFKTARILSYGTKGDDYVNWDVEKIHNLYTVSKLIEEYSGEKLLYLDLRNPHNAFAQLQSVKLRLGEIDPSIFDRIKPLSSIMPEIREMQEKIKYIDLSWKESKYIKLNNQIL